MTWQELIVEQYFHLLATASKTSGAPTADHLALRGPLGTLTSADGRTVTLNTLE
jgi:hypothetical protein